MIKNSVGKNARNASFVKKAVGHLWKIKKFKKIKNKC